VALQVNLQASIATLYAITCGRPCFAIDTVQAAPEEVAETMLKLLQKEGIQFEREPSEVTPSQEPGE
jgi:hypothetical protein